MARVPLPVLCSPKFPSGYWLSLWRVIRRQNWDVFEVCRRLAIVQSHFAMWEEDPHPSILLSIVAVCWGEEGCHLGRIFCLSGLWWFSSFWIYYLKNGLRKDQLLFRLFSWFLFIAQLTSQQQEGMKRKGKIVEYCNHLVKETDGPWQMCKYCPQFILHPLNVDLSKKRNKISHSVIVSRGTLVQSAI